MRAFDWRITVFIFEGIIFARSLRQSSNHESGNTIIVNK